MLFCSFSAALNAVVNPDNVKASVRLYICGADGRIIIECSMNALLKSICFLNIPNRILQTYFRALLLNSQLCFVFWHLKSHMAAKCFMLVLVI